MKLLSKEERALFTSSPVSSTPFAESRS